MRYIKSQSGFTLIEALIYIALFAVIIGGLMLTAYQIFEATAQVQKMAQREVEYNFVLEKIMWVLARNTDEDIIKPLEGEASDKLRVTKGTEIYEFSANGSSVVLTKDPDGSPAIYNLSNPRVLISEINFIRTNPNNGTLKITMVVDGQKTATTTLFLR